MTQGTVLINGASVAGPTLAYWLTRAGFRVTLLERATSVRPGGYPIDVRGAALDVADRMGLLPTLRREHISTRQITFVGTDGTRRARMAGTALGSAGSGAGDASGDVELPRGVLTGALYELTRDDVEYRFSDSVRAIEPCEDGVRVSFERARPERYDLVVGADGMHSTTRRLAFGPESGYSHHLGLWFAGFSVPNEYGLHSEAVIANTPGRMAALYAVRNRPDLHALLVLAGPASAGPASAGPVGTGERAWLRENFSDFGWHLPRLLELAETADDLYVDSVSQIRMPAWTTDRVALVGDAAYAPSFLSGQGTSLAVVGAYLLARALGKTPEDLPAALSAYQRRMDGYVRANQALVSRGSRLLVPATRRDLLLRNGFLRLMPLLNRLPLDPDAAVRKASRAITLDPAA